MDILSIFILICILVYCLIIFRWLLIWQIESGNQRHPSHFRSEKSAAVIVAVRNEEKSIGRLLKNLELQEHSRLEVVISDDFSDDKTEEIVQNFIRECGSKNIKFKWIKGSPGHAVGKKAAIERAISVITSDIIITTDADCQMNDKWVSSILFHFENRDVKMVSGSVVFYPTLTFFQKLQALEFSSLSFSSAVSIISSRPIMCNGANLAYLRSTFLELGGYKYGVDDVSGDDTYLMLSFSSAFPGSVKYNRDKNGIVVTKPLDRFVDLVNQRIRWASKIKNYKESYIKLTGLFLFMINSLLLLLFILSFTGWLSWEFAFIAWLIKASADFIVLYIFLKYTGQRELLFLFLPLELIYPVYTFLGGMFSLFNSGYQWKGRKFH